MLVFALSSSPFPPDCAIYSNVVAHHINLSSEGLPYAKTQLATGETPAPEDLNSVVDSDSESGKLGREGGQKRRDDSAGRSVEKAPTIVKP